MKLLRSGVIFFLVLLMWLIIIPPLGNKASTDASHGSLSTRPDEVDLHEDFVYGGIWYIKTKRPANGKNGEVYAAGCAVDMEKLVIPAIVEHSSKKYDVVGIADDGFAYETAIKSLTIENGVKYIGSGAFWGCIELENAVIADSVNEIGNKAFTRCQALKQINIPNNLKVIPEGLFMSCTALKTITLGKNVTTIERESFGQCESLKTVKFNKKLKTIGQSAFTYCKSLESVKFPKSLKTLSDSAFVECDSLKSITIPKKIKEIPNGCFSYCDELKTVKLPKNIKKIGFGAFDYCISLETVSGKNSKLSAIEDNAFFECKKLKSISIPNVTEIGKEAFYGTSLTTIKLSDKLKAIGERAFACSALEKIVVPGNVKVIREETFASCRNLKDVVFKRGVERLEGRVFDWCDKLTAISFPDTINYVAADAVVDTGWFALAQGKIAHEKENGRVTYDYDKDGKYDYSKRPDFVSINDICIWADHYKAELVDSYWRTTKKSSLTFPEGTRVIACGINTLDLDGSTNKIIIPEGVEILMANISLGIDSTYDKSVELSLPSSLKVLEGSIRGGQFKSVTLPENLETLGKGVFSGAKYLEEVHFSGKKLKEISVSAFQNTSSLKKISIPEGVELIDDYAFDSSGIAEVSIPSTVKSIGKMAFFSCPIEKVSLPKILEVIGESAFRNTKISKIDLPDSLKTIGLSAFEGTAIRKFTLPDEFEIEKDFIFDNTITVVVKKNSKAHKALEVFMTRYGSDFWTIEYKK